MFVAPVRLPTLPTHTYLPTEKIQPTYLECLPLSVMG